MNHLVISFIAKDRPGLVEILSMVIVDDEQPNHTGNQK